MVIAQYNVKNSFTIATLSLQSNYKDVLINLLIQSLKYLYLTYVSFVLQEAIVILGFSPEERLSMYKIAASILNFGNIKLKQRPRDEQAEVVDPAGRWFGFAILW